MPEVASSEGPQGPLNCTQAGLLISVHPETIRRWAVEGKLRGFQTPGGRWRFFRADVERLMAPATKV